MSILVTRTEMIGTVDGKVIAPPASAGTSRGLIRS
jgi:hypothetical protein